MQFGKTEEDLLVFSPLWLRCSLSKSTQSRRRLVTWLALYTPSVASFTTGTFTTQPRQQCQVHRHPHLEPHGPVLQSPQNPPPLHPSTLIKSNHLSKVSPKPFSSGQANTSFPHSVHGYSVRGMVSKKFLILGSVDVVSDIHGPQL